MGNRLFHILIKPDAFIRGIVIDVIEYMRVFFNLKIYSANVIEPNEKLLDIMYDDFKWKYDYIEHNRQLYKFGPSLSLVCSVEHDVSFKDIKGNTLPMNNSDSNSVRSKFCAVDRSINIIHIADDFEGCRREINQIYHSDCMNCNELLEMSIKQIQIVIKQSSIYYDFFSVLSTIQQRLLTLLNCVNKLNCQYGDIDSELDLIVNSMPRQYRELYNSYNSLKSSMYSPDLSEKLKVLGFFYKCARECNQYISQYELYALYSQAYYYDVNSSFQDFKKYNCI